MDEQSMGDSRDMVERYFKAQREAGYSDEMINDMLIAPEHSSRLAGGTHPPETFTQFRRRETLQEAGASKDDIARIIAITDQLDAAFFQSMEDMHQEYKRACAERRKAYNAEVARAMARRENAGR